METNFEKILSLDFLKIGYVSGKSEIVVLPPLTASAKGSELIAVIGRNGIGKSTLLRTLTGLQRPLSGQVCYKTINIRDYSKAELARKVGYISTETIKVSNMRVYDLVALGRFPHTNWIGKIKPEDHEKIVDALQMTSMLTFQNKLVSEISDGERQKAMIARILAQDTEIMIMDEPTAFLDVASKFEILQLMHLLSGSFGKTIIFSTHDLQTAISYSDKIWLLLENRLIEGAPEDLTLAGAFDHLFESSAVVFDYDDGTFTFRKNPAGIIFVEGEGNARHWTEKAISRAGYEISRIKTTPYIITPGNGNKRWQVVSSTSNSEFSSIYELVAWLRLTVKGSI